MPSENSPDPFETLNAAFLKIYDGAVAATLARTRPIVLVNRPKLILFRDGRRDEATVLPPLYNHLKAAAHVPLGTYALLAPFGEGLVDAERLAAICHFRDLAAAARDRVDLRRLTAAQRVPLVHLLDEGLRFLNEVIRSRQHVQADLVKFLRSLRNAIDGSIAAAVQLEIDAYHAQMTHWRKELTADEWRQLRVVVMEAPQARRVDLGLEYFARLLGEPVSGGRIFFAESLYMSEGEQWALDHIGKQELDTAVASAFFNDPQRLDRDILGDAAVAYLESVKFDHHSESGDVN
ncbi:MAG: hypothetical protein K2R98_08875 [Gemmataceae bacterium]|nr:hypothetical protein [Gemmataceae bacterium]